jgi:hypothetical protein
MKLRIIVFALVSLIAVTGLKLWQKTGDPIVGKTLAIETLNGGEVQWAAQQAYNASSGVAEFVVYSGLFLLALVLFLKPIKQFIKNN